MNIKKTLIGLLAVIVIWNFGVWYVDYKLKQRDFSEVYSKCYKVWNSRGMYRNFFNQNTISAINKVFKNGGIGVEFDFHYDIKTERFIIGHDILVAEDGKIIYIPKNGRILTMKMLFEALGDGDYYFWLDYKNLDKLSDEDTLKSIKRLKQITKDTKLLKNLYIEGSNPFKLSLYAKEGIKTLFGIHPIKDSNIFSSIVINGYKIAFYISGASAIAMEYGRDIQNPVYGEKTKNLLKGIPIFLFHVKNDKSLLKKLVKEEGVRVILVNAKPLQKIDFREFNSCK